MGCRESKNKEPTTGELSQTTTADDRVKALVSKVKADVEAEYGKEFTTFEPVSFRKQAVALNVYYVKIDLGGEYAHIKVCDTVPKECEKAATSKASPEKKTEEKKEENNKAEEKGEGSEEKGEGSEEKGEGSEDAKDGSEEKETKFTEGEEVAVVEEKKTATLAAVQKGKKLNDEIVEFETSEEASEEEEEVTEEPKEEVKEEEPKEEEVKEEEPKEEEQKEEEPKKEEDKEEEKEEGDSSLISTIKSEASDALGF